MVSMLRDRAFLEDQLAALAHGRNATLNAYVSQLNQHVREPGALRVGRVPAHHDASTATILLLLSDVDDLGTANRGPELLSLEADTTAARSLCHVVEDVGAANSVLPWVASPRPTARPVTKPSDAEILREAILLVPTLQAIIALGGRAQSVARSLLEQPRQGPASWPSILFAPAVSSLGGPSERAERARASLRVALAASLAAAQETGFDHGWRRGSMQQLRSSAKHAIESSLEPGAVVVPLLHATWRTSLVDRAIASAARKSTERSEALTDQRVVVGTHQVAFYANQAQACELHGILAHIGVGFEVVAIDNRLAQALLAREQGVPAG